MLHLNLFAIIHVSHKTSDQGLRTKGFSREMCTVSSYKGNVVINVNQNNNSFELSKKPL